jgi:RHS repeat-associated protein
LGQNSKISYFEFDNQYRLSTAKDGFGSTIISAVTQVEHDNAINQVNLAASAATHEEQFSYNFADARTKYAETGNPDKNYTFFAGHRIKNDGSNAYDYYTDGILKSDGMFEYEVDSFGRVVSIKAGATVLTTISYDAFSRPSSITELSKPKKSFNYLGGFIVQENDNDIITRQITLQPITGAPIAYHSAAGTHYSLFDGRFNLIGLMDTNGSLLETFRYKSYGQPEVFDLNGIAVSQSAFGIVPIFGGQKYLSNTGLYLSKHRLLNPNNGVFLSADSQGYTDSSSLHVYARQNPINFIDPEGDLAWFIPVFVIGGELLGIGYAYKKAADNPEEFEGDKGPLKVLGYAYGGAAIGGVSVVAAEGVLAVGGVSTLASGTTATATSLTATQTFVLYGTSSATAGIVGREGFNAMFPEYIDPVSVDTIASDFILGGGIPVVGSALRPMVNGAGQMISRSINGPWRAFGNNWRLLSNPRTAYSWRNIFSDSRTYNAISKQYWRGQANGNSLQHLWSLRTNGLLPQRFRNAGWNLLEVPRQLNTWMGDILARNYAFRAIVGSILTGTGLGSYYATDALLNSDNESSESNGNQQLHPNEKPPSSK